MKAIIMDIQKKDKVQIRLLLSPKEAGQALAISERTLWQLTKDGAIESIKVGTRSVRAFMGKINC